MTIYHLMTTPEIRDWVIAGLEEAGYTIAGIRHGTAWFYGKYDSVDIQL